MKRTFEQLLSEVTVAGKEQRNDEVWSTFQDILKEVQKAIGTGRLRGLPNLGTAALPYYAIDLHRPGVFGSIPFPKHDRDEGDLRTVVNDRARWVTVKAVRRMRNAFSMKQGAYRWDSLKPWFEFVEESGEPPTARDLAALVVTMPQVLEEHLKVLASEKAAADAALAKSEARKLVKPITHKMLPYNQGRKNKEGQ